VNSTSTGVSAVVVTPIVPSLRACPRTYDSDRGCGHRRPTMRAGIRLCRSHGRSRCACGPQNARCKVRVRGRHKRV
jgi:hypothetical protein